MSKPIKSIQGLFVVFAEDGTMRSLSRRYFCSSMGVLAASAIISPVLSMKKAFSSSRTGYAYHPDFEAFENNSSETFLRAQWINSRMVLTGVSGDAAHVAAYGDPMEYIRKIHTQPHIDLINGYSAVPGFPLTLGQVAQTAVGYVLGAVNDVCSGSIKNAFCCIRPPGHHVQNSGSLGYCCYANVVLAARFARERFNIRRILIIDWDFHQGNGTHGHICNDNDILFFETFCPDMYSTLCNDFSPAGPDFDFPEDARRISVRMPSGSTGDDFVRVFETILVPAAERFQPELVLISCGFDLKKFDSHNYAGYTVTANTISRLTRIVKQIADTYAGGKLVSMLEGGYVDSPRDSSVYGTGQTFSGLSQCAENHVKTLITGEEQPETPFYSSSTKVSMRILKKQELTLRNGILFGLPLHDAPHTITITGANGRVVKQIHDVAGNSYKPPLSGLAAGRYLISVQSKRTSTTSEISIVL